jgi:hypothetical protein
MRKPLQLLTYSVLALGLADRARAQRGVPDGSAYLPSEHFAIVPNAATFNTLQGPGGLIDRIENTYRAVEALTETLGVATSRPAERLTVILFDSPSAFENYASGVGLAVRDDFFGFYDRGNDTVVLLDFTLNGAIPRKRSEISRQINPIRALPPTKDPGEAARRDSLLKGAENAFARVAELEEQMFRTVVQHEVAHQLLSAFGALPGTTSQPAWLVEGMATLFETPLQDIRPGDPGVNEYRLTDFRVAASSRALIPWARILSDDALFKPDNPKSATAYAQAWMLVYWAIRERPEELKVLVQANRVGNAAHVDRVAAFESVFGRLDDGFDARLTAFADHLTRRTPTGGAGTSGSRPSGRR